MSTYNVGIDDIVDIAKKAGDIAMQFYDRDYVITDKNDKSPVTEADLAVHHYLIDVLSVYNFPILSEEGMSGFEEGGIYDHMWIADPLDGTKDFIQKTGEFAIMIGLVDRNKESILGVVYAPAIDELYWATKNGGAFCTKGGVTEQLHVSAHGADECRIFVSRNHLGQREQQIAQKYHMEQIAMGSAGLKICRIAAGQAELYINSSDKCGIWDTCAADIILREAGGNIVTMNGECVHYDRAHVGLLDGFIVSNHPVSQMLEQKK